MTVFEIGSVAGHWVAFALFGAIAIFCGYAVSHIARRFAAPSGESQYLGTTPRARRTLGAALAGVILAVTCVLALERLPSARSDG